MTSPDERRPYTGAPKEAAVGTRSRSRRPTPCPRRRRTSAPSERRVARAGGARGRARARAQKVQDALYRIAEAASVDRATSRRSIATIHAIVGELMYAENFYIALYDEERQAINFPYYVDTVDTDIPDPNAVGAVRRRQRPRRPRPTSCAPVGPSHHRPERARRARGAAARSSASASSADGDWLGAPLMADGRTLGVIVVQTYTASMRYTRRRPRSARLRRPAHRVRARAAPGPSRRPASATPSWRSSTRSARRSRSSSTSRRSSSSSASESAACSTRRSMFIALYDAGQRPRSRSRTRSTTGERDRDASHHSSAGLTSNVIQTGQPLRLAHQAEEPVAPGRPSARTPRVVARRPDPRRRAGARRRSSSRACGRTPSAKPTSACWARSPRAWASRSRTPGCSTRRSACWPRPTSAPPSWRSSTASSRASPQQLDMQAMYDLVGDKIQEIFDAQVVDIGIYDRETRRIRFPYTIERGRAAARTSRWRSIGFRDARHRDATSRCCSIDHDMASAAGRVRQPGAPGRAAAVGRSSCP